MLLEEIKTVTVIGREWVDRVNGNTYHNYTLLVNGKLIEDKEENCTPIYGGNHQYEYSAIQDLMNLVEDVNGWDYVDFERHIQRKIPYFATVSNITRKRDL